MLNSIIPNTAFRLTGSIDWAQFLPPGEEQRSNLSDSQACVSFSAIHCIESQELQQTGQTPGYSERALAKMSGTITALDTPNSSLWGNYVDTVYRTILRYGLIKDSDWPTELGDSWNLEEFYKDIPAEILAKAIKPKVVLINGSANYSLAPVWTTFINHAVEGLNPGYYFDSYQQYVKPFDSYQIFWQGQLVLNPKDKRMLVFFQVKGSPTVWALMDGQFVGFADYTAFNNYVAGRPHAVIELDQSEFAKVQSSSDVFKS